MREKSALDKFNSIDYQMGYTNGYKDGYLIGIESISHILETSLKPIYIELPKDSDLIKTIREGLNQQLIQDKAALTEENAKLVKKLAEVMNEKLWREYDQKCERLQDENATLTAQVAAYREELETIKDYFDNPKKYGGAWPEFYSAVIKRLLSSPDPGEKYRAVVEAAKVIIPGMACNCDNCVAFKKALAALEGGRE